MRIIIKKVTSNVTILNKVNITKTCNYTKTREQPRHATFVIKLNKASIVNSQGEKRPTLIP